MKLVETKLKDVYIIEPQAFGDHRGFFMESYNKKKFEQIGLNFDLIQDNHSLSVEAGTIRGLHYQLNPKAQTKIVRALTGAIYDVVVDIRKSSPTFGQWIGVILSDDNKRQIVVPKGFAHGICTLVPNTQILYKVDEYYSPENDRGILWNDPDLGIDWPTTSPILSDKDMKQPRFKEAEINFE
ncbi:dTDP-4-dehydrorhamnose 3,5-epimerase [Gordoniibacillus kamchatkensis]|uniref:dTDP-4-dehydrorhamnose 3,5-epimerase n=1 Tax=Gordoniibacillus kamchatkensis TaxID=1590651 RepID=A0ABR5AEA1_9BACL|nr:dTDP-4-dehydrorhamnose 3,5-epimerase [Paenibacillus sp. VKM B-2647]KIL38727.1 dTDP-4-dehydrorhamnose 3,5-epimerase [Paenibacillus sp. VKM B-2647]